MKQLFRYVLLGIVLMMAAGTAFGIEPDAAEVRLIYFDDPYEITVTGPDGFVLDPVDWDMEIPVGSTVKTGASTAELELLPNGSIIKLSTNTQFIVEGLQTAPTEANSFTLLRGKLRTVAARYSDGGANYSILTPSAVCGVRGTDFGLEAIPSVSESVAVIGGSVEFINLNTGETIEVDAGELADVFAARFEAAPLSDELFQDFFSDLGFVEADPVRVPGIAVDPVSERALVAAEETDQPEEPDEVDADDAAVLTEEADGAEEPETEEPEVTGPEAEPEAEEEGLGDVDVPDLPETAQDAPEGRGVGDDALQPVYNFLSNYLGMELGAAALEGNTYAKVVFLPKLEVGKFRMALYLPIIYNTDLMDPSDWYRPQGNNEWSFGTDQTGTWPIISDILTDLALKIKYIEYGDYSDPFFFKVGNVESVTLGHGMLMSSFPFDTGFPAIRRIGINMGLDKGAGGFEAVLDDLSRPQIMGGRIFYRPFPEGFAFAVGLSSILDLSPAASIPPDGTGTHITYGNPLFMTLGLDLDFPILSRDSFKLTLFSDVGALVPYYRESYGGYITPGFAFNTVFTGTGGISNYGIAAGAIGSVSIVDWRLEYRMFRGIFEPGYFSSTYERIRGAYVREVADFLADPTSSEFLTTTLGIYGQFGVRIGKAAYVEGGYFWPWEIRSGSLAFGENDFFHFKFVLNEGVIPVVGIYGSLTFDRTKFVPTILQSGGGAGLSIFDAYTTITAEVIYPVAPVLDIAFTYSTGTSYGTDGSVVADSTNPNLPAVRPSITIETRLHF
jgi:hypothetical protein